MDQLPSASKYADGDVVVKLPEYADETSVDLVKVLSRLMTKRGRVKYT